MEEQLQSTRPTFFSQLAFKVIFYEYQGAGCKASESQMQVTKVIADERAWQSHP